MQGPSTIRDWTSSIDAFPGFQTEALAEIAARVKADPDTYKYATLAVDGMGIKKMTEPLPGFNRVFVYVKQSISLELALSYRLLSPNLHSVNDSVILRPQFLKIRNACNLDGVQFTQKWSIPLFTFGKSKIFINSE